MDSRVIAIVLFFVGVSHAGPCENYEFVTRAEWNARPPTEVVLIGHPVNMTFVHHSAGAFCFDKAECIAVVQGIQNYHMDVNGWEDIGYNFLIGEDGRVYEGRGWDVVGAHTLNYNSIANGFCVLGDFTTRVPNDAALNATKSIITCGVEQSHVIAAYELFGHRDGRCTACPGDELYAEIQTWPPYSFRPIPIYC